MTSRQDSIQAISAAIRASTNAVPPCEESAADQARAQLRAIHRRRDFFGKGIGDVGCAILLDLFINAQTRPLSVSDACLGSGAPPTTALRCLTILIERGMIARTDDLDDRRRVFVALTKQGRDAVTDWLAAI